MCVCFYEILCTATISDQEKCIFEDVVLGKLGLGSGDQSTNDAFNNLLLVSKDLVIT